MPENSEANSIIDRCLKVLEGGYGYPLQMIGIVLFVLVFNWLVKNFLLRLRNTYSKQHKVWKLSFVSALYKPLSYFVWFVAIVFSIDMIADNLLHYGAFDSHFFIRIGAVIALSWFLLRWNLKVNQSMRELRARHKLNLTAGNLDVMSKLATIAILIFSLFLLLDATGSNVQTLIAFGGVGGLALAFASQQVISNFFGGLMVYLNHPFTIGEVIKLPEKNIEGEIEEIGWYMTCIRNLEKRPIYVPNSVFTQTTVINNSRLTHERVFITLGLRYQDINVIKDVVDQIKMMLLKHSHVDHHQKVEVSFIRFGPHALDIEISAYIAAARKVDFVKIRQDIFIQIASIINEHGAELAAPTTIVEIPTEIKVKHHALEHETS